MLSFSIWMLGMILMFLIFSQSNSFKNISFFSLNPLKLKELLPNTSDKDIRDIIDYFGMFDIVAFLQSGMNTKSAFALTPFVSQERYYKLMDEPIKKLKELLVRNDETTHKFLTNYTESFVDQNAMVNRHDRVRGKNYSENVSLLNEKSIDGVTVIKKRYFADEEKRDGLYDYDHLSTTEIKEQLAKYPNYTFVYEGTVQPVKGGNTKGNWKLHGLGTNVIPLTVLNVYNEATGKFRDVNGHIAPEIQRAIDNDISKIVEAQKSGKIAFNKNGYGQYMLQEDNKGNIIAKETFLYLSNQLYEKFGYLNPGFITSEFGSAKIQESQEIKDTEIKEISDRAVRDFMNNCF